MNITEYLTNYTTIDQLPNSKSFVIETENLVLIGRTVTLSKYNDLVNPFSSFVEESKNNNTDEDDSESNNTDIYKVAIAQYNINPYAADTQFPYQS